ncbi:TetR/AcrR family transcriptional regulator [Pseudonocardia sp. RS010]|uniref:TetR/AcrR family transcriptional regulator n=1 Tax=Pseudonocardia sp. RS010 TaxID=3385979 RepID=UPI0039A11EFE
MPVARSRGEQAAAVRLQILDAALECLVDDGFAEASTVKIQERAGVSRGGLLHHFPSRESLLVAAAQHLASIRVTETATSAAGAVTAAEDDPLRIDQAIDHMWRRFQEPYFWAAVELWVASLHDRALRTVLRPAERELGARIRTVVDGLFGPTFSGRRGYSALREMLLTSMRGVALTYAFEPRVPEFERNLGVWKQIAHVALESG